MIKIDKKLSTIAKPIISKKCIKVAMTTLTLNLEFRQAKSIKYIAKKHTPCNKSEGKCTRKRSTPLRVLDNKHHFRWGYKSKK